MKREAKVWNEVSERVRGRKGKRKEIKGKKVSEKRKTKVWKLANKKNNDNEVMIKNEEERRRLWKEMS